MFNILEESSYSDKISIKLHYKMYKIIIIKDLRALKNIKPITINLGFLTPEHLVQG